MQQIYTIGYGGRDPKDFVALLQKHQIPLVVDTRLRPDKASLGIYSLSKDPQKGLSGLLSSASIAYLSLIELGNVFLGRTDWRERYQKLWRLSGELLSERLRALSSPLALLCAEKDPAECHRTLIAEYLREHYSAAIHPIL